jgi:hypothetical protein
MQSSESFPIQDRYNKEKNQKPWPIDLYSYVKYVITRLCSIN